MNYIIMDLEFNQPIQQRYKHFQEIIEIGAVKLDSNLNQIDTFQSYVNPTILTVITKRIKKLTGITQDVVNNSKKLESVLFDFLDWAGTDFLLISFGFDDLKFFILNCQAYNLPINWLRKYVNIQMELMNILDLNKHISLIDSLRYFNLEFEGVRHKALDDCINTVSLFKILYPNLRFDDLNYLKYFEPVFQYSFVKSSFRKSKIDLV